MYTLVSVDDDDDDVMMMMKLMMMVMVVVAIMQGHVHKLLQEWGLSQQVKDEFIHEMWVSLAYLLPAYISVLCDTPSLSVSVCCSGRLMKLMTVTKWTFLTVVAELQRVAFVVDVLLVSVCLSVCLSQALGTISTKWRQFSMLVFCSRLA